MNKPKTPQKENPDMVSGRDLFQTPDYATEILLPFIEEIMPMSPFRNFQIWECASGQGKIVDVLRKAGYSVLATDLSHPQSKINFLTDIMSFPFHCIVTNPPFSLKRKFYEKCRWYGFPFALLIPADYSGWIIKAIQEGAEKIIPTRRVDYITPNKKESHAQFHSMWLTWGFGLGRTETFVELTKKMKENI